MSKPARKRRTEDGPVAVMVPPSGPVLILLRDTDQVTSIGVPLTWFNPGKPHTRPSEIYAHPDGPRAPEGKVLNKPAVELAAAVGRTLPALTGPHIFFFRDVPTFQAVRRIGSQDFHRSIPPVLLDLLNSGWEARTFTSYERWIDSAVWASDH